MSMSQATKSIFVLCSLVGAASAQSYPYNPYTRRRHRLAGGVIAGIVVACIAGLLLCCLLSCMGVRRRRGQPVLPGPGGFTRVMPFGGSQQRYNANSGPQPGHQGGAFQPPSGPPPYQGTKETYPGQLMGNGAPQPGGFAPPPGPPPQAHFK